ncbi:hypothetical protein [Ketogulonicigenium vulgare]|uniref:Uncharacterized protein n=1 Tax=Ketogulonicigenium vulgare (strain WSH-001) TaxID=759362 RepID=F9Y958_KETVW|nr:hypothetical protein [Ketogulonicigenium vulgare]ADO43096.1 hypothetical protein EIO_1981 [Ketogulonicigenium vulgare Y25]AEM41275.1 hypothetical protein KVU_1436 [Ketogulonicigenium vulgare WSH-001]ALJ81412.1 hypothetical protein KVH_09600 [Ketogulonicigenium vulgare]ANW34137.1 hypothetical protein KvSKV_09550 [Ketogulonicigenium vulgare]AOZ55009.1 hypothetical protein KVC_2002 [Ketogulonicigenium vulgare]
MLLRSLLLTACLTCLSTTGRAELVEFPEDGFWWSVARAIYDREPDFDAEARRSDIFRNADEFARDDVLIQEIARLQQQHIAMTTDLQVRLRVDVRLDDYDSARGGFPISLFEPGTYLGVGHGLIFGNSADYAVLKMDVAEARALREREAQGGRKVGILTLGDFDRAPGNGRMLMANVYNFEYFDQADNLLASLSVQPEERDLDPVAQAQLVSQTQSDLLESIGLPPLGSGWDVVRDALVQNYDYAISDMLYSDDARFRLEVGQVSVDETSDARRLRVGFGNAPDLVSQMFALQAPMARMRIPQGQIDVGFTGRGLDCGTPEILDACGVLIFDKLGGSWILTGAEGVRELDTLDYIQAVPTIVGDDIFAFVRTDQHVAYPTNWVAGRTDEQSSGSAALSARYTLGAALESEPRYVRPTEHWRTQSVNHEVTLYAVDGANGRTPVIFTMALPLSDQPSAKDSQAAPTSRSSTTPPPFGTMPFGNQ